MRRLFWIVALGFASTCALGAAQCGGTERWRPKVGTDQQAGSVELTNPQLIDIHDLIALAEPQRPNDDVTRLVPDETHVYVVRAFMLQFKEEQNDSDYHIVITDDTHTFTDHNGNNLDHSVIAEIPDPNCLQGKNHQFPGTSQFVSAITATRALMDQRFPNAAHDGSFNPVGLPVEITAIGFFDRPHGQIGRATNNIELHPILRLCFLDTPQPQCSDSGGGPPPTAAASFSSDHKWLTLASYSVALDQVVFFELQGSSVRVMLSNQANASAAATVTLDANSISAFKSLLQGEGARWIAAKDPSNGQLDRIVNFDYVRAVDLRTPPAFAANGWGLEAIGTDGAVYFVGWVVDASVKAQLGSSIGRQ
jgi:hypothetical protein